MNTFITLALAATLAGISAVPAAVNAQDVSKPSIAAGKALYNAKGSRIASVYRVTQAGAVQIILEGKLVTVPNDSLSQAEGKLVTSLTKSELLKR